MNLKDFFTSNKQPCNDPSSEFWALVRMLCQSHVEKTVAYFHSKDWPRLDWAEPRLKALTTTEALDWLIREARNLLTEGGRKGALMSSEIFRTGSWAVMLSIFPSANDNDFISACPERSYEQLALKFRASFRDKTRDWENLDYAHWLLLIDELKQDAAINLHTIWSLKQHILWTMSAQTHNKLKVLVTAPCIVPVDLIRTAPSRLIDQILRDDLLYSNRERRPQE